MKFSVRLAVLEDAAAIGAVHANSWKTAYQGIIHQSFLDSIDIDLRIQGAINRIKNPAAKTLVLVENTQQQVVGFSDVGPCREKKVDSDGELYAIYLFKEYQGYGGGRLLFEASISAAKEMRFSKMMVYVLEQNTLSRKFYEKMAGEYIGSDHVDIEEHRYQISTYLWRLL